MIDLSLSNGLAYSTQVLLLVLAAEAGARLLPLPTPRARFVFWRGIVAGCLVLPGLALLRSAPALAPATFTVDPEAASAVAGSVAATTSGAMWLVPTLLWLLASGIVLRTLWLLNGLARLRRLRNESDPLALDEEIEVLRRGLAFRAVLRTHPTVRQPITFGLQRPIVLLPDAFETLPIETQRAVACHELLHVQRRDWIWMLGEELVRTLFWFHPAMRWALNQIQLGREEVVDARTVELTGARRAYLSALLTFAGRPALAPATLFARRHHLGVRIRRIAEEVSMSRLRFAVTGMVLTGVLAASSWGIVSAVPLHVGIGGAVEQAPVSSADNIRVSLVGQNLPKPVTQVRPEYPADLLRAGVGATITLTVTVSASGRVADVRDPKWQMTVSERSAIDDMPGFWARKPWLAFVEAAGTAIKQWTFEPAANDSVFPVTAVFRPGQEVMTFAPAPPPPPPPPPPPSAEEIELRKERLAKAAAALCTGGRTGKGEQPMGHQSGPRQQQSGSAPDSRATTSTSAAPARGQRRSPARRRAGTGAFEDLRCQAHRIQTPQKHAGVQGIVIVEVVIGIDGSVAEAQILRSIPMLDDAALEAVTQWRFEPVLLNGAPVEAIMAVTVNFTLQ